MNITDYTILVSGDSSGLIKKTIEHMRLGWQPVGNLIVSSEGILYQTMVKYG